MKGEGKNQSKEHEVSLMLAKRNTGQGNGREKFEIYLNKPQKDALDKKSPKTHL